MHKKLPLTLLALALPLTAFSASPPLTNTELTAAYKLYSVYCVKCHGTKGKGDGPMIPLYLKMETEMPSNFTIGFFENRPMEYLRQIITKGGPSVKRGEYMPPFETELTAEQIDLMVRMVKQIGAERKMPSPKNN